MNVGNYTGGGLREASWAQIDKKRPRTANRTR
jgi:hypothetical protein